MMGMGVGIGMKQGMSSDQGQVRRVVSLVLARIESIYFNCSFQLGRFLSLRKRDVNYEDQKWTWVGVEYDMVGT
jgi:hypothetical protein